VTPSARSDRDAGLPSRNGRARRRRGQ
jgi:hypothetical protein